MCDSALWGNAGKCNWCVCVTCGEGKPAATDFELISRQQRAWPCVGGRVGVNLRLGLRGVVAQGHAVALDLVEALLTEVVPVGDKAMFG